MDLFRRASGGPIFSLAREKIGEKRALGYGLVRAAGTVQASTNFLVVANTHSHPTGAMVRAACHGTPEI